MDGEIILNLYNSSLPGNSGGTITTQFDLENDWLVEIPATPMPSPGELSTCFKDFTFAKVFLKNESSNDLVNVELSLYEPVMCGALYLCIGTDSDTTPPVDDDFTPFFTTGKLIIPSLSAGASIPLWVLIKWPDASGITVESTMKLLCRVSGVPDQKIDIYYNLALYVEHFVKGEENDYTSWLKDMFIIFLRNALYRTPRLDFRWHPWPQMTKIFISDRLTYNLEEPEKRPSIVVTRGGLAWRDLVMNQTVTYDMLDRTTRRTDLIQGNFVLQCVAREGLHAESLATMLFKMMKFYKDDLRAMGLHEVQRVTIGEEVNIMADTRPEAVMVPVNVGIVFQDSWNTWQEWPRLKGIDFWSGDQLKTV